jgi:hypothetical protein
MLALGLSRKPRWQPIAKEFSWDLDMFKEMK